mmetsp:Transcript_33352/g.55169  ORF Transcript_33352/g.55169 Transcript_33352/m.55169 type:complete len:375 (+) Transcript_33352:61-1185(+)
MGEPNSLINVGGEQCEEYDGSFYAALRAHFKLSDDFLVGFNWHLACGGGKGGNKLGLTDDRRFMIKELSLGDHQSLLELTPQYCAHVLANDRLLLAPFFAHIRRPSQDADFVVMGNTMVEPNLTATDALELEGEAVGAARAAELAAKQTYTVYDLKGSADDKVLVIAGQKIPAVHLRWHNCALRVAECLHENERAEQIAPGRVRYFRGKLHAREVSFSCTAQQHSSLLSAMTRDVAFLREHGLMDYSLLLSIRKLPIDTPPAVVTSMFKHSTAGQLLMSSDGGKLVVMQVGLIDFLQRWTLTKQIARQIKFLEFNKATEPPPYYAARFLSYFARKFKPIAKPWPPPTTLCRVDNVKLASTREQWLSRFFSSSRE